ncbi:MAG: hypothetical protein GYA46_06270, partial [candidate division Zixibacteria bacterium]|nr:hypothetical protein [candidate division Zixibacteria bacterium]
MTSRAGYTFVIVLLVMVNILLLWQVMRRPGETSPGLIDPSEYMTRTSLPDVCLLDSAGQSIRLLTLIENQSSALLIV